jgi:hypothetical protein
MDDPFTPKDLVSQAKNLSFQIKTDDVDFNAVIKESIPDVGSD